MHAEPPASRPAGSKQRLVVVTVQFSAVNTYMLKQPTPMNVLEDVLEVERKKANLPRLCGWDPL